MFQVIKRLKKHGRYIDQDYDNNEVIKKTAAPVTFVSNLDNIKDSFFLF